MEQNEVKEPENKLVKRILPHQGHRCFEYNVKSNELSYAMIIAGETEITGVNIVMKKVDMKEDCVYITALNFKNAVKHLRKMFKVEFIPVIVK